MYESFETFCKGISTNEINFLNKKIDKIIKNLTFFHVTRELFYDYDQKIFQDYENSNLIIIKYYNKSNKDQKDQYFFIIFKNHIMIIEQSSISFLQSLFSFSDKPIFCFLPNTKEIFDSEIEIQYKEIQYHLNYDEEVNNLNEYFLYRGNKNNLFWKICRKSLCYYFIHQGHFKRNQNRTEKYFQQTNFNEKRVIEEEEYLILKRLGIGSESQANLIYHIEREELMVLKTPINASSIDNEKLYKREIRNYFELKHPFLPEFYGVVKDKNYIVIEYISGNTLFHIKNLEINEKIEIILSLMLILLYLHENQFIYRDLKPDNIMIDNNKRVVLIDFDRLIKTTDLIEDESRTIDFNSEFIAPEVNTGKYSYECDIYSLGKIIYFIFNINSKEMSLKKYPTIEQIYTSCINIDPEKRPPLMKLIDMIYSEFLSYIPKYINKIMLHFIHLTHDELVCTIKYFFGKNETISETDLKKLMFLLNLATYQKNTEILNMIGNVFENRFESSEIICGHRNIDIAMELYEMAFKFNDPNASYNLARIYFIGKHVERNMNKVFYYLDYAIKQNHLLSKLFLGALYSKGYSVSKDLDKAKQYFEITEEVSDPYLQYKVGMYYLLFNTFDHKHEKAIEYLTLSANQNFLNALIILGQIYSYGIYIDKNIEKAIHYFSLAADQKDYVSQYELGKIYFYEFNNIEKALLYMKLSSDSGYLYAQQFLGIIYFDQKYIPRNIDVSFYYLEKAASKNDSISQFYLGCMFSDMKLSVFNIKHALYYLNLSADQNNVDSLIKLAKIYIRKEFGVQDIQKSLLYLEKAVKLESVEALIILGEIYYFGIYVPKDIDKSIYYFSLAKNQNNADASYSLGVIYEKGNYVRPNITKAIEHYSFAAKLNHPNAQLNLGYIYLEGKLIKRDIEKALYYLDLAAHNSNVEAQYNLGLLYEKGELVQQNMKKSIFYYELAAYRNDGPAQYKLGFFYIDGKYVERNINKGFNFLILSSENGFVPAHFMIGYLYHEGKFVRRDINKAIHYYKLATSFNYQYALNNLGNIYKNGFEGIIEKNVSFAIEYFNDAVCKKYDVIAMYNLANIYLYDIQSDNSVLKSIDLLINSLNQDFDSTRELLLIALIKQFDYDYEKYEQIFCYFGDKIEEALEFFIYNIESNKLNEASKFEISYEYYRNVDFIYNYKKEIVPSKDILNSTKNKDMKSNSQRENIDKYFYDGFGFNN